MVEFDRKRYWEATSYNERFAKMAGVFSLKSWYELVTVCPADSSVNPATSASRHHVVCNGKKRQWQRKRNQYHNENIRVLEILSV